MVPFNNITDRKDNLAIRPIKDGRGICQGYTIFRDGKFERDMLGLTRAQARVVIGLPAMVQGPGSKPTLPRSAYPQYTGTSHGSQKGRAA
jgi:hypothetical protein